MTIIETLKEDAYLKLREAEKAVYKWACEEEIGSDRTYAFNLYEIVRTAPREANK
jgi:hypothetical protein